MKHAVVDRLNAALEGRYRIERELGEGGMATVYLAEDLRHDRKVALKVLKPELAAVVGAERFLAEIKTTASLQHPHILPLHDSGEADGFLFYVMPYVEGESLREKLDRERQLPVDDATRIAAAVASGLDFAHRQGVVHRDIKPANILLQDGQPVIADFGIALAVQHAGGGRLTETGLSLGTPYYMSPEQATADRDPDARSDVYSLGCVLYEMLTGDPPFQGSTAQAVLGRILTGEVQPPTELRKSIPPHVEAVVLRSLERLPADRLGSAADFAAALSDPDAAAALAGGASRRERRPTSTPLVAVLATLVGVLAALAAFGWLRQAPPDRVSRYAVELPEEAAPAVEAYPTDILPDGSGVVFLSQAQGPGWLWYRPLDSLEPIRIAGTEGALNPAVSPGGDRVAFVDVRSHSIKVAALTGGGLYPVTDSLVDEGGLAWGADGYIYYDGHLEGDGIARVPEDGGTPEVVTRTSLETGELWHNDPHPLPGGRGLLFSVARGNIMTGSDYQVAVTAGPGEPHKVLIEGGQTPRYSATGHLLFVREGDLMSVPFDLDGLDVTGQAVPVLNGVRVGPLGQGGVAVSEEGTLVYLAGPVNAFATRLVWVDREGQTTRVDMEPVPGYFTQLALAPDGRSVALPVGDADGFTVWTVDLEGGNARKLTFEGYSYAPFWTPDGRDIFFARLDGVNVSLARVPADGRTLQRSGFAAEPAEPSGTTRIDNATFGPDGRVIYAVTGARDPVGTHLAVRFPHPDSVEQTLVDGPGSEARPQVSPDGRWLAYASDETGQPEIYVRPFPDVQEAKALVSRGGGVVPRWSPDGSELFYTSLQDDLMAVRLQPGESFNAGSPVRLFSRAFLSTAPDISYDPHPDGRRFLMIEAVQASGTDSDVRLVVVEGFDQVIREAGR
jgi:Tol biopolymer transport system component